MLDVCFSSARGRIARPYRPKLRQVLYAVSAIVLALPTGASAAVASTTTLTPATSTAAPVAMTLTATVTPKTNGSITFCDDALAPASCPDADVVGKAQLTSSGTAILTIIPATGSHSYYAIFAGTNAVTGSSSSAVVVAGLYPTSMTLTAPLGTSGYDLTSTVTGLALQQPIMTGSVTFQDLTYGRLLGTAPLSTPPVFAQNFLAPGSAATGPNPADAAVGDFNEDGKKDLAVVIAGQDAVSILLGNGDGTFQAPTTLPSLGTFACATEITVSNCSIAVGDFNDDGHADLAVTIGVDDSVTILLGNGNGSFGPPNKVLTIVGSFPEAVRVGDFDNDGVLDLVVANAGDDINPGTVSLLKGKGDGTFTPFPGSPMTVGVFPFFLAVSSFNADNNADIAVVNRGEGTVTILLGNGDGTFAQAGAPILVSNPDGTGPIVAAKFSGDTAVDLAVATYVGNVVKILKGNGQGQFVLQQTIATVTDPAVSADPFGMVGLDYNGDGYPDLAVSNYTGYQPQTNATVSLLKGSASGFTLDSTLPLGLNSLPNDVVSGDFNGDGEPDLAVPLSGGTSTTIFLDHATQTATAILPNVTLPGPGPHTVQASYPAAPGNTGFGPSSAEIVLQGLDVATTLTLTANPTEQMITMPVTFTAQLGSAINGPLYGAPTGTVTFYDHSLGDTQLGTAPMNSSGQAVLTVSNIGPGLHSIFASYSGDTPFFLPSGSNTVVVTIDELRIMRVGHNNTTILPGTTVVYTLQVEPEVATAFLYSVSFTASGLPAGATATFSPVTLPAGGKTTNITMTVKTAASALNEPPASPFGRLPLALGLLLPLFGVRSVRRRLGQIPPLLGIALLAVLSLAAVAGLSGCSGAGLFAARKVPYPITVTAMEGTVQRSTQVPLAIQ